MIDARALHGWLGPKQRFNDWVRERLSQYAFEEGTDFYCFSSKTGGRPRTDYFLTINMAKELAMVERTPIGQMTRRYFIKMEEAALERGFLPKFPDKLSEEILSAGCFGVRGAEALPSLEFPDRLSRKPRRPINAHPWR